MEPLVADLGKTFIEKLINGVIEKSRYIFCFTCIVKEFNEEKLKLEAEKTTMEQRFKVATQKNKNIPYNAQFWEKQVDMFIQEDTKTKQNCFFGFCPNCIWRYKRGEDLATKIVDIQKLVLKGEKFVNVELDRPLPGVERYSSQYYISFESRELKYKDLLNALKDDSNYLTGLYGMGGTGKTTLAKEAGKHVHAMKQFDHVIDTTVSNTPDIKKIQDDIAGSLGLIWGDCNESDRPKELLSRLTNGEKILLILDDVWGHLNFDEIGIPHSDNNKGCKILVTTRNLWVCNKMTCGNIIQLELLTEEEAWVMFKMYCDINNNFSSKSFFDKGRKIAIECKRLPVAIAVTGSSLKGKKRQEDWDAALTFLQKPISMDGVDNDLVDLYKCLKFSYDNLKDRRAKALFLLFSIFEEDAEIPVEFLTRLAIGVSIFGEYYSSYDDVRGQAIAAKNILLDSCLLLETEEQNVKMHDMVREVAQWIANKEIHIINFLNKNQKSLLEREKNIKYLTCQGKIKDLLSSKFDGSKLELLFVFMEMSKFIDIPISFLENIIGIRVLILIHYSGELLMNLPNLSLPQSIQSLTNIRTLIVHNISLSNMSILGKFPRLETLDLVRCDFDNLPCEIEKLENLRLLNLQSCNIECNNPFEVIQNCSSLEVLYFCDCFNDFCKEITLPSTLQRYRLIDDFLVPDSLTKCVALNLDDFTEATYKYVIETAEFVKLESIKKGWRNLMPEIVPIDKGMNDLIELHLKNDSQIKFLVDTKHIDSQLPPNVFSKLVVLHLKKMRNLEALYDGHISFDSLSNLIELSIERCEQLRSLFKFSLNICNLKTLKLISCSNLVSVFELSTSKSLLMLEKLEIYKCDKLENIFTNDTNEEILDVDDNMSFNPMFPMLKVVDIKRCDQLQFIFPFISSEGLFLLEDITIEFCEKLAYIFGQHQQLELASLKVLNLSVLPNFIDIFQESHHSTMPSSISKVASKLQTQLESKKSSKFSWSHMCCYGNKLRDTTPNTNIPLVSEDQQQQSSISMKLSENIFCFNEVNYKKITLEDIKLDFLPMICPFVGLRDTFFLQNLKRYRIRGCENLKSVFPTSIIQYLPHMERIFIEECNELKHIIEDDDDLENKKEMSRTCFPKLSAVIVINCNKLKSVFPISVCKELPELKALVIREAKELEEIFKSEDNDDNVEIPNLNIVVLVNLPSLFHAQRIHFQTVENRSIQKCPKLSLTSTLTPNYYDNGIFGAIGHLFYGEWNSSKDLMDQQHFMMGQQQSLGEIDTVIKTSHGNNNVFESNMLLFVQIKMKQKPEAEHEFVDNLPNMETNSKELTNEPTINLVSTKLKGIEKGFEEETTSTHFEVGSSSSTPLITFESKPSSHDLMDQQCLTEQKQSLGEIDTGIEPSYENNNITMKQTLEAEHEFVDNVPNLDILSVEILPTNSKELIDEKSMDQQHPFGEIDTIIKHSQGGNNLVGSTSEQKTAAATTMSTVSETNNEPTIHLVSPKLKGIEKGFEEETTLEISSSTQFITSESKISSHIKMKETPEAEHEFVDNVPNLEIPSVAIVPTNYKESLNENSMHQQHQLGKNDTSIKHSQGNNLDGSTSEHKPEDAIMSSISETKNEPTIHLVSPKRKGIKKGIEEATTSTHFELRSSSSTPLITFESKTSSHEDGDDQIDMNYFPIATTENNDAVKLRPNVEQQSVKGDEIIVLKIPPSFIASQIPSMPFEGDSFETLEDLSSSFTVTKELEELVSKKHLDYENLSLLTDFLVQNPWVRLRDTSLSNRYKGCAYKLLAELLKFVQTHSVLDVLGSYHSEFVELLHDARSFGFDKDWLDGIEKRALFSDIQVSQNALQKLLDSKQQVTKDIEVLCLKIDIFSQHVEDLMHQLTSAKAILENITQQEMTLSAPIGY